MRWKPLLHDVVVSTALALAVSGVFAHLGASPLLLSLGVLLSAGPATDVALELIRSRNPTMVEITAAPRWMRWIFPVQVASIAALSFVVSRWCCIPYWETFAVIWLIAAAAGAVNPSPLNGKTTPPAAS